MSPCYKKVEDLDCLLFTASTELPSEWDRFVPQEHALVSEQLLIAECSSLPDISFIYVLVMDKGNPIAAAYFQSLKVRSEHINREMVKKWQSRLWTVFTKAACPRMLVAGHLFRHDTSYFYFSPTISTYQAYQCYHRAIDAALQKARAGAVLVKDMPEDLIDHFQNHAPQYLLLRNDISMEMDIPAAWNDMQDYEKALKHKYAQRYRKIRQQWQSLEIKELSIDEVITNKEKIHSLYEQVMQNQQVRLGILSADFLVQMKHFYKEKLKIWAAYDKGIMTAFFSAWAKDDALDMFYIGFDYSRNSELQLYFNILYFSIEQAIALRKSKLILGRTALDAKARLGCEPQYLHTFLYISNPLIRPFVLKKQQNVSLREGDWEEKHPLKELRSGVVEK